MREEMGFVPREARWTKPPGKRKAGRATRIDRRRRRLRHLALGVALGRSASPTPSSRRMPSSAALVRQPLPGCGVDTPNHSYSFSFGARKSVDALFSPSARSCRLPQEGRAGIRHPKASALNTELTSFALDESKRRWISTLKTADGEEIFESTTLVSAIGQLNGPLPAHFRGEETFKGETLRTRALWSDDNRRRRQACRP